MNIQTTVNNKVTDLLNAWYIEIRNRNVANAYKLKEEIESAINNIEEDQNLLLYYSLLDFGYKYLIDNLSIAKIVLIKLSLWENQLMIFIVLLSFL